MQINPSYVMGAATQSLLVTVGAGELQTGTAVIACDLFYK